MHWRAAECCKNNSVLRAVPISLCLHERRRPETGEAATIDDIAEAEKVTDRFVSRMLRLAYLSPDVLERLLVWRDPPSVSVIDLIEAVNLPWAEQQLKVFGCCAK
jgi:hypothetical protein